MANNSSPVSGLKLFRHGERYMKTWPVERRLSPVFLENRVINVTRFAMRLMPPLALFATGWQMVLGGQPGLTVATALFACSLPLQGLWWLGKRAVTPLPPALLHWYHEVRARLAESGAVIAPPEGRPDYQALAEVLKRAFRQPDKIFPDGF